MRQAVFRPRSMWATANMTETFSLHGRHVSARAVRVVLVLILSLPGGTAWTQDRAEVTETPAPTAPALPPAPNRQPGLLEALGRWVDDSVSGVGKGFEKAWRGTATARPIAGSPLKRFARPRDTTPAAASTSRRRNAVRRRCCLAGDELPATARSTTSSPRRCASSCNRCNYSAA
jgi:hypothetical protein